MVEDHAGLNNERIGEEAFLDQCEIAWREREAMMLHELERFDDGLFYCLFDTPDRVQHLFWRFREPDHPANRGQAPDPDFARVDRGRVPPLRRDRRQGARVRRRPDAGDRALRPRVQQLPPRRPPQHWLLRQRVPGARRRRPSRARRPATCSARSTGARTRAYALGLGGIYLNLKGREGQGIVPAEEAEALKAEIARAWRA